jgi:hypothetical protein
MLALLVVAAALAGCSARGSAPDYFAYTKKPLYVGTFDLAAGPGQQNFDVEDGSISALHVQVWVNATKGGAHVEFLDATGHPAWSTDASATMSLPVDIGTWTVNVTPAAGSAGNLGVVVLRG